MTIRRATPGNNPFTIILNEVINDNRLGTDGLAILVYLISKPADWDVKIGDLKNQFGIGRDKAYKALNHLVDLGYAQRYQGRDDTGGFSDRNYLIFDRITRLPENQETAPLPENPHTDNQTLQRKEEKQSKDSRPVKQKKIGVNDKIEYSEEFETGVWQPYPRREGSKKKAYDFWNMLNNENRARVVAAIPLFSDQMKREGRPSDKVPHLTTWFNDRRYETVISAAAPAVSAGPAKPFWETATRKQWGNTLLAWSANWQWSKSWGPEPGQPGCHVPPDILDRFDLKYRGHLLSPESYEALKARVSQSRDGGSTAPPTV